MRLQVYMVLSWFLGATTMHLEVYKCYKPDPSSKLSEVSKTELKPRVDRYLVDLGI